MRLVAFRAPARVADERRRKARAHLQNRCQLSKAYLELQNWTLFVTHVPTEVLARIFHKPIESATEWSAGL